jgi:hypothetical protein
MAQENEYVLVKRPHQKEKFTDYQISEFVKCASDPKYFIRNYVWVQHPTRGKVPFELYEYQDALIDVYHNNRYSINMLGRQMGKSTCAAAYLLWYAMFNADTTILIAAHKHTGSQEIMQRIRFMYEHVKDFIRAGSTSYNKGSIEFENGSRIVSATTTETTGRGMSLTLVYLDEFAYVPPRIAKEFWTAISPTLSTGGKCIITSTPNQDDDQFAQIWKGAEKTVDEFGNNTNVGVNGFKSIKFVWDANPERDQKWADEERYKIGDERFRREHLCEFITDDETLVNAMYLVNMHGVEPVMKAGQVRYYKKIEPNKSYVLGWDPSLGTGGDMAAIQAYELPSMEQVAEWQHNKTDIRGQLRILIGMTTYITEEVKKYGKQDVYWSVENNTLGEAALVAITEYGEDRIPGLFISEPGNKRRGFTTTHKSKLPACATLKHWIETDKLKIKSKNLVREVKNFVAKGNGFAAKEGETDDLVMATILCVRLIDYLSNYDQNLYESLKERGAETHDIVMPMPIAMI